MHGPKIDVDGKMRKTYLFAILDDHSRLITHGQFYLLRHWKTIWTVYAQP
jgi:putative transposase